ncbi:MAG: hypothetical protein AAGN82_04435 [Myxococcota bacterium]
MVARDLQSRRDLMETLEHQVIPRLVMAHCSETYRVPVCRDGAGRGSGPMGPSERDVARLAEAAVAPDPRLATALVAEMLERGVELDETLLDYVGAAASLLGAQWADDRRSWSDVTLGAGNLQRAIQWLSPSAMMPVVHRGLLVLTVAPGEQHTMGMHLLAELARREGWGVHAQPSLTESELLGLVEREYVTAVGVSAADADRLVGLGALVTDIRRQSHHVGIEIFIGGSAEGLAEVAERHGVQYAADARTALQMLDRIDATNQPGQATPGDTAAPPGASDVRVAG